MADSAGPERPGSGMRLWRRNILGDLLCLALGAVAYYGQYYDHGFNIGDEGAALEIARRLLSGETPYVDVRVPYGLLWYLPLVGLFRVLGGPDFVAMKILFHGLATVTAVLGYAVVVQLTGRRGFALLCGSLLVLVPGPVHKAGLPLVVVANMYVLSRLWFDRSPGVLARAGAAAVVSASWLVRPDVALVATVLLSTLVLRHLGEPRWIRRTLAVQTTAVLLIAAPFAVAATTGGYASPLMESLLVPLEKLRHSLEWRSDRLETGTSPALVSNPDAARELQRIPPREATRTGPRQTWAALTYLPLVALPIAVLGLLLVAARARSSGATLTSGTLPGLVVSLVVSFSNFPQFFVGRPDPPHLAQFMPGYVVLVVALAAALTTHRNHPQEPRNRPSVVPGLALSMLLGAHVLFYLWTAVRVPFTGSIGGTRACTEQLEGANGVRVFVAPAEHRWLTEMQDVIERHAAPDERVVCLPYAPGFNVLTGRPSGLRELIASNTFLVVDPGWQQRTIRSMRLRPPAVVTIGDLAINGTEVSRFANWATEVMAYLVEDYVVVGVIHGHTVWVHRDRQQPPTWGGPPAGFRPAASSRTTSTATPGHA